MARTRESNYEYRYDIQMGAPTELGEVHNEAGNVLWADGHVTTTTRDALTVDDFDRRK